MWLKIGLWVLSTAISILTRPKPEIPQPATLGDFDIPVVQDGRELPLIGGTVEIEDPQMAWHGDLKTQAIRDSGGKK
ncbi:MAG: hypothetical protein COA84_15080 [Robiginitomaculum sp.]|nr:MAG: hypothetical protein COA84_15080 [Robiginitomaculum sp.]